MTDGPETPRLLQELDDLRQSEHAERLLRIDAEREIERLQAETPRLRALLERATEFLAKGGLFNPELMEQAKATHLLLDMRDALQGVLVMAGAKEPHNG